MAFQWPRSAKSQRSNATVSSRGGSSPARFNRRRFRTTGHSSQASSTTNASSQGRSSSVIPQRRRRTAALAPSARSISVLSSSQSTNGARGPAFAPADAASTVHEPSHDDDADALNEIVMAVEMRERGTVGCSYYVAAEETLYFMEDVKLGGIDIVENLKLFINPTIILISTKCDEQVTKLLDPDSHSVAEIDANEPLIRSYLLEQRPAAEFYYENAKSKLISLRVGASDGPQVSYSIPGDIDALNGRHDEDSTAGGQAALLRLSSWIMLDSQQTVGCAGAIISYLQRRRAATFLPGDEDAQNMFRISTIEMFTLRESMFINSDTLLSLQVLQSESHPHLHNQGPTKGTSGSKEGLSVYGLFHHFARTPQGKYMLKQYFLRPSLSLEVITERHEAISVFLRSENEPGFDTLVQNLKKIVNVRRILVNLKMGVSAAGGKSRGVSRTIWRSLHLFAYHVLCLTRGSEEVAGCERLAIFRKIRAEVNTHSLAIVGQMISDTIDFERSDEEGRAVVRAGIDPELDEQRRLYDGIDSLLSEVAREIASSIPDALPLDLNVVYLPQIGFLVKMPMDQETGRSVWEGTEDDVWEKMFNSENEVYYKNESMREMDARFGDVYNLICDKEIEIIHGLVQQVLEYEAALSTASDICGELDCLCALAQGAAQHRLQRPRMVQENVIDVRGGRHPLQELTVPSFVPNDSFLVGGEAVREAGSDASQTPPVAPTDPAMLLMTGPNYSGKSVYLKQVALIVYMAHIGSFVPAESARIGITDKILTRISTRESVSRNQSAFMIDLQQICMALSHCTPRSLLIIDEFGKGTNAADGAGLAAGVFEYLLSMGAHCPKVLAATHYHEIFEAGFLKPQPGLQFAHMEIRVDEDATEAEDQVTYLYNFRNGRSVASYGTVCAAMNGIGPEMVRRAEELVLMTVRGEDLVSACAVMPEEEMHELAVAERIARKFLDQDIEDDPRELLDGITEGINTTKDIDLPDRNVVSVSSG